MRRACSVIGYNETLEGAGVRRMISPNHEVLTGLDVLEQERFAPLEGKRVGLITNQTGRDREDWRNMDAMIAGGVKVTELFSPEHGITGGEDRPDVADSKDAATGLEIWSLHDNGRYRMTPEMLRRRRRAGLRYSGRRRAILHLFLHHAVRGRRGC